MEEKKVLLLDEEGVRILWKKVKQVVALGAVIDDSTKQELFSEFVNRIFPPGSGVYFSFDRTSPASKFGGTWRQITDVFVRAANDNEVGGSEKHSHAAGDIQAMIGFGTAGIHAKFPSLTQKTYAVDRNLVINGSPPTSVSTTAHGTLTYGNTSEQVTLPPYQDFYVWVRES